jgi:serine protease Do
MTRKGRILATVFPAAALIVLTSIAGATATGKVAPAAAPASSPAPTVAAAPAVMASGSKALLSAFSEAFEQAAQQVNPSVVPIFAEQTVPAENTFFNPGGFGGEAPRFHFGIPRNGPGDVVHGLGSGVIVTHDGVILTNSHVIENARKVTVVTADGKRHTAKVVGSDPQTDLAVIKIEAEDLSAADLGDSDHLRVGQWVIAVGNPLEMLHSVTAGIVSATGRSSVGLADYENFIQTDASINPGNSGGALADMDGKVIGINTAIASPSGGSVGVGFAIPINMARHVMDELIAKGSVTRGYLAVTTQNVDEGLAKALDLPSAKGAIIGGVDPGGPAAQGGLREGDVIVKFDGNPVEDSLGLRSLVAEAQPGHQAKLSVLRDGKERDLDVTLGTRPGTGGEATPEATQEGDARLGIDARDLTPELARRLGYEDDHGALVATVEPGSPAAEAGLARGDLIEKLNRTPIESVGDLRRAVSSLKAGDTAAVLVRRGDRTFFVGVEIS